MLGLKNTDNFLRPRQLRCFANKRAAADAGFSERFSPSGEIFSFDMTPGEEVPPVDSSAGGACVGFLVGSAITVRCVHTVTDSNAAHIHTGAAGVSGPVLCPADNSASPLTISCDLSAESLDDLADGNLYVNVHSPAHPGGEVRGQIPGVR